MDRPSPLRYREQRPGAALAPVVETFWTLRGEAGSSTPLRRILPDGCMDVILDVSGTSREEGAERPVGFAVGTMTTALTVRHGGRVDFVGVRFRPGAARVLLGPPASEFTDAFVDLDALWGPEGARLWDQVAARAGTRERLALLGDTLLRRMDRTVAAPDGVVRRAAALLLYGGGPQGPPTVAAVATRLGVSRRHLERRFGPEVGISPGQLKRVGRLRRAARIMWEEGTLPLATLAARAGYHDQPHMTRDFQALAGVTPAAYRRELARPPGRIRTSQSARTGPP